MLGEQRVVLPSPEEPAEGRVHGGGGLEGLGHPASLRRKRTVPVTFQQTAPTLPPAPPQAFSSPPSQYVAKRSVCPKRVSVWTLDYTGDWFSLW